MFIAAGAANVQWVWSIDSANKRPQRQKNAIDSYPGDQYVDIVGMDGYNGEAGMDLRGRFGRHARRQGAMDHRSIRVLGTD
jgi:beta-mannanase